MSDEQEYVIVFGVDGDPALVEKERDWVQVDDLHGNEENWVEDIESDTDTNEKTNGTKNVTQLINDLEDYQETLEAMDPITQIYQKIINGINQMRLYNQSIHDAIVLATDQVQDKRIDWLEEGPEVTTTDILLEFALVFFLDSGLATLLLKTCIKKTFKFAADEKRIRAIRRLGKLQSKTDAELLKGTKKLYRMDEEYKSVQKQINKSNNKVLAQRIELDKFYDKKGSAIWNRNKKANDMALARAEAKLKKYTDETKGWLDQKAKLNKEIEEFVGALKTNQREIEKKQLLKWFLSGKEKSSKSPKRIAEMARGAAKAIYTTSADEKEISLQVSNECNQN